MTAAGLPTDVERDLPRFLDRNPEASVAVVLGRFGLDPEEYAGVVADRLDQPDPLTETPDAGVSNWGETA
ncbi:MAG: hypothetical protein V5A34_06500 [Halapricum sp.]